MSGLLTILTILTVQYSLRDYENNTMAKSTVLITGCSDGGLGSALALALHAHGGYRVFATARNTAKLQDVKAVGIETLRLDVLSDSSIQECVAEVRGLTGGVLDILVNNAGAGTSGALADLSIDEAKKLFDLNVWANLATIQAFLPLLLKSTRGGLIVNHTSVASVASTPFMGLYGASKAALATFTKILRIELSPFGIKVVDLKSGSVKSNITANDSSATAGVPKKSLYYAARDWLDQLYGGKGLTDVAIPSDVWAKKVVAALSKRNPPEEVWVGAFTTLAYIAVNYFPKSLFDKTLRDTVKFDRVEKSIQKYGKDKAIADAYRKE